jgi:hypothetical protein
MPTTEELLLSILDNPQFGGPAKIRVAIDTGPDGVRGTFLLLSDGDPNSQSTTIVNSFPNPQSNGFSLATFKRYDLCFALNPSDQSYLTVFIYQDGPQGLRWYPTVRLTPEGFPGILSATFVDGSAQVFAATQLPLEVSAEIGRASLQTGFDLDTYLTNLSSQIAGLLNINFSIINANPIAASIVPDPTFESPVSVVYTDPSVAQYSANIVENSREIILTSGDTAGINVGEKLFKQGGDGVFGSDPIVTSITSNRRITVSTSHTTSGPISFASNNATVALNYLIFATECQEVEDVGLVWIPLAGEKLVHVLIALTSP